MAVKVPKVKRCCCFVPLRVGIVSFACVNIVLSVLIVTCLMIKTQLGKKSITPYESIEPGILPFLLSVLGLGVIFNFLLLFAGYQKDIQMLRLHNLYATLLAAAGLMPSIILLYQRYILEFSCALVAMGMQIYLIIIVRSQIIILEEAEIQAAVPKAEAVEDEAVDVPDCVTLV